MARRLGPCVAAVVGSLALAGPAAGATLHMEPNGSGAACSAASPCGSMNAAYRRAGLGDVVRMAPGAYGQQTISGRSLAGVDSLRPSGEEVRFEGPRAQVDGMVLSSPRGAPVEHVTFEGLTFTDWVATRSGEDVHFVRTKHRAQLHANWVSYLSYQHVEVGPFSDDTGDGLQFNQIDGRAGDHILVEASRIHDVHPDNESAHPDAVQLYGAYDDFTFRGNRLWNNDNINYRGDPTMRRLVVENNFFGPAPNAVVSHYYAAQLLGNGAVIRYNSFVGALQPSGPGEGSGQVWEGNILTWTTCRVAGSDSTVRHNVFVRGVRCGFASKSVRDPRFVDPGSGDLHLRANSPAVGAGHPTSFPGSDIDGERRPAHGRPDAGADERGAGRPSKGKTRPRRKLIAAARVRKTRGGYVVRMRLRRPARVAALLDRRRHGHYRVQRHRRAGAVRPGTVRLRLGRLQNGRYRVRLTATEPSGKRSHRTLRFRVRLATRLSA